MCWHQARFQLEKHPSKCLHSLIQATSLIAHKNSDTSLGWVLSFDAHCISHKVLLSDRYEHKAIVNHTGNIYGVQNPSLSKQTRFVPCEHNISDPFTEISFYSSFCKHINVVKSFVASAKCQDGDGLVDYISIKVKEEHVANYSIWFLPWVDTKADANRGETATSLNELKVANY